MHLKNEYNTGSLCQIIPYYFETSVDMLKYSILSIFSDEYLIL